MGQSTKRNPCRFFRNEQSGTSKPEGISELKHIYLRTHRIVTGLLIVFGLLTLTTFAEAKDLWVTNESVYLGNGQWQWSIFLKGPRPWLRDIAPRL